MATFVILSKVSEEGIKRIKDLGKMEEEFEKELKKVCPEVKRIASYALLGAYDFLHIIEAPDALSAAKAAIILNYFGATSTQTLTAIPFKEFAKIVETLK
ncbi:MAG: GYD domain-containing protein [Anaerolineae bacterium]|nr:GYD domain-containing protein [Anaerolineae bacterium]MDW8102612.1 GYD domain-containing protein [Anaerolineae bacterium]